MRRRRTNLHIWTPLVSADGAHRIASIDYQGTWATQLLHHLVVPCPLRQSLDFALRWGTVRLYSFGNRFIKSAGWMPGSWTEIGQKLPMRVIYMYAIIRRNEKSYTKIGALRATKSNLVGRRVAFRCLRDCGFCDCVNHTQRPVLIPAMARRPSPRAH